ncbi:MAG: hypothetical protein L0Y35_09430, partial [Flammeovirgaceae bacterium]|nr:hypothetical protein [Flammeovirgaceae bacterium]
GIQQGDYNPIAFKYEYYSPTVTGEINFHIGQRLALGAFWTKSFEGKMQLEMDGQNNFDFGDYEANHQMYGVNLRLSASRKVGFRPYLLLSYYKFEMYMDMDSYRLANRSNGIGINLGAMIKLNDKFYLNAPDIGIKTYSDAFFFAERKNVLEAPLIEFRVGLTYNFTKRK